MPWFKVDDAFHSHPKVVDVDLDAVGLWLVAGTWCANYLTDGLISMRQVRRLGGGQEQVDKLVDSGLWVPFGDGWQFKDWDEYQPSKEEVEAERKTAKERMRALRAKRKGTDKSGSGEQAENVRENTERSSGEVQPPRPSPSQPDPTQPIQELVRVSDADFEQAWAFWPKKVERKKAAEMFKRVAKKLGTQELIQHVHVFGIAYAETTDRQFVPALDVWLRNERWTDELPRHPSRTQPQRLTRADENALEFERLYGGDQHGGTRSVPALDAGFGS